MSTKKRETLNLCFLLLGPGDNGKLLRKMKEDGDGGGGVEDKKLMNYGFDALFMADEKKDKENSVDKTCNGIFQKVK